MKVREQGAIIEVTDRALELELIGCMVESPIVCAELLRRLEPADFASDDAASLFRLIARAYEAGRPTDPVAVNSEIRRDGEHALIGVLLDAVASCAMPAYGLARAVEVRRLARLRRLEKAGVNIVELARSPGEVDEKIGQAEASLAGVGVERDRVFSGKQVASAAFDRVDAAGDGGGPPGTVATGMPNLDRWMKGGLQPGHLVILAARPSIGKTAFACTIARHVLRRGGSVLFASLEMGHDEVGERLALIHAGDDSPTALVTALAAMDTWPLRVLEAPLTVSDIRAEARRMRPEGLTLVIVDYVGLLTGGPTENRAGEIGFYARGLQLLARELGVPVLLVAQVNRAVEHRQNSRPSMADLRDSGELEQHAHDVLLLSRKRGEEETEVIVDKQRNGATGIVQVLFQSRLMRFVAPAGERNDLPEQRRLEAEV